MNRKKETALFLVDCLAHMPSQKGDVTRAVNTVVAGLTLIADGGEWPEEQARAASRAAVRRAAAWAAWTAAYAAYSAADAAADAAFSAWAAADAADWAARAHPDPDAERERQAKVRQKLGLNTEGA